MVLERELATFERELPNLLASRRGRYVLIHGDTVDSDWATTDEAYDAGCDRFGIEPFLVMLVTDQEEPISLPYNVIPYADPDRKP